MKFYKRTLLVIFCLALSVSTFAQIGSARVGVIGGLTSSGASTKDLFNAESRALYHFGVAVHLPLGRGLAIQPALQYQVKGATLKDIPGEEHILYTDWSSSSYMPTQVTNGVDYLKTRVGFLEIPVQIQYGLDLMFLRPYIFAEPFIGYAVKTVNKGKYTNEDTFDVKDFKKASIDRFEYGLGLGAGLEFWRLQLSFRYSWNFGSLHKNTEEATSVGDIVKRAYKDKNFKGFALSAAYFF